MAVTFPASSTARLECDSFLPPGNKGTISIWIKPAWNTGDNVQHFIWRYQKTSVTTGEFDFQKFTDNKVYIGFNGAGLGDQRIVANVDVFANGVYANHIFTWDTTRSTTCEYIVNGVSKGTRATALTTFATNNFAIGNSPGGLANSVQGAVSTLDDFCCWNEVLTPVEIQSIVFGKLKAINIRPNRILSYFHLDTPTSAIDGTQYGGNIGNFPVAGATQGVDQIQLWTPKRISIPWPIKTPTAVVATTVFRRTASRIGTRTGTRQTWAA